MPAIEYKVGRTSVVGDNLPYQWVRTDTVTLADSQRSDVF